MNTPIKLPPVYLLCILKNTTDEPECDVDILAFKDAWAITGIESFVTESQVMPRIRQLSQSGQPHIVLNTNTLTDLYDVAIEAVTPANVLTPEFSSAMHTYNAIAETHGEESPEARQAWLKAMALSPDWFIDQFLEEHGEDLGPDHPDGFTESGEPLYTLASVAAHFGITEEEAKESLEAYLQAKADAGKPVKGLLTGQPFHRVH